MENKVNDIFENIKKNNKNEIIDLLLNTAIEYLEDKLNEQRNIR